MLRPSQLRYAATLSSASTVATESSKSTIVVTAASASTSWIPAGSVRADRPGPVDDELEVQAVMAQQHARRGIGVARVPGERGRVGQPDGAGRGRGGEAVGGDAIAGHVPVRRAVEGHRLVEDGPHGLDHPLAADRVVGALPGGPVGLGDRVGAVERVVQRSPARVGGVDREPGVGHRDHQLRAGDRGDLGIDPVGADLERPRVGDEIADLLKERPVLGRRRAAGRRSPGARSRSPPGARRGGGAGPG